MYPVGFSNTLSGFFVYPKRVSQVPYQGLPCALRVSQVPLKGLWGFLWVPWSCGFPLFPGGFSMYPLDFSNTLSGFSVYPKRVSQVPYLGVPCALRVSQVPLNGLWGLLWVPWSCGFPLFPGGFPMYPLGFSNTLSGFSVYPKRVSQVPYLGVPCALRVSQVPLKGLWRFLWVPWPLCSLCGDVVLRVSRCFM